MATNAANTGTTTANIGTPNFQELDIREYKSNLFLYLVFILKFFSDKDHPIDANEIATRIYQKFYWVLGTPKNKKVIESISRPIRDRLNSYYEMRGRAKTDPKKKRRSLFTFNMMTTMLGGTIEKSETEKRPQKYYFKPLLDSSDLMLIESSLITNRNLLDDEREYLMNGLDRLLSPGPRLLREKKPGSYKKLKMSDVRTFLDPIEKLRNKARTAPAPDDGVKEIIGQAHSEIMDPENVVRDAKSIHDPMYNRNYLNHIQILDEAIRGKYQVELRYGKFDRDKSNPNRKMRFGFKRAKADYTALNPYALLSNQGHMYLIATVDGYDDIKHYRVDRIMDLRVRLVEESIDTPNRNTRKHPKAVDVPRAPIPAALKDFFKNEKGLLDEDCFNEFLYINRHPMMGIYKGSETERVYLRTLRSGLPILYDYFGDNIDSIEYSLSDKKDKNSTISITEKKIIKGEEREFTWFYYDVRVKDVCDENMLLFLSHHHDMFEVLEPKPLREKLKVKLEETLEKYKD